MPHRGPLLRGNVSSLATGSYRLQVYRTGYKTNDAQTAYLEMGSPKALSNAQLKKLQQLTADKPELSRVDRVGRDGKLQWKLPMRSNDIALLILEPLKP